MSHWKRHELFIFRYEIGRATRRSREDPRRGVSVCDETLNMKKTIHTHEIRFAIHSAQTSTPSL